jgi:lysozyme
VHLVARAMMEAARHAGKIIGAAALVAVLPIILTGLTTLEAGKDRGKPYRDGLGRDAPWTVCDGVVVKVPRRYSAAECDELAQGLVLGTYGPAVIGCVPALGLPERRNQLIASVWFAWNLGGPAFCRSTAARLMNVGQWREGCGMLAPYNRARGKVLPGLVRRRRIEVARCLQGL